LQGEVSFVFQLPSPLRDSGTHCIGAEIKWYFVFPIKWFTFYSKYSMFKTFFLVIWVTRWIMVSTFDCHLMGCRWLWMFQRNLIPLNSGPTMKCTDCSTIKLGLNTDLLKGELYIINKINKEQYQVGCLGQKRGNFVFLLYLQTNIIQIIFGN
jgi:hypothetical protein